MTRISAAFLPLTDSAVLVAAHEKGFARDQGIELDLVRSESWATLRDRLVYGQVEVAQMLGPLAIAVSLGLSQHPAALSAPFKLSVNGNLFVMGSDFAAALEPDVTRRIKDPVATAHDFAAAIGLHRRKPVIGIVHRYSCHALLLRYWLGFAGVDPDRDLVLRVLPPSLMGGALRAGEIDGFIAGEPWNTAAVLDGDAEIVMVGERVWQRGVEKVLGLRTAWMEDNPDLVDRLLISLDRAAAWCDDPRNHSELAALLAKPNYVGQPAEVILPTLAGRLVARRGEPPVEMPATMLFHREAVGFPWRSHALWIYSQLIRWGMATASSDAEAVAAGVFRSDVYRRALGGTGAPMPGASLKVEGALSEPLWVGSHSGGLILGPDRFFDGRQFDPTDIGGYLDSFQ